MNNYLQLHQDVIWKNQSRIHNNKSKICNMFESEKRRCMNQKKERASLVEQKGSAAVRQEWEAEVARCGDGERKKKSCRAVSEKEERGNMYCVSKYNHMCVCLLLSFLFQPLDIILTRLSKDKRSKDGLMI